MVIAIAGKNNIAVNALEYVKDHYPQHEIVVVCNRNEDGKNGWQKSLRYFAGFWGIKEVSLADLYEIEDLLFLSLEFDLIVRTGKFKSKQLYNMHFSLLPKYKGMFTAVVPLLNNETESGVTLHKMEDGIDTGDILAQKRIALEPDDCASDLYQKCLDYGFELFKENIGDLIERPSELCFTPQDATKSTYYSKSFLDFSNIQIDLNQTAQTILNQIRAFNFRNYQLPKIFGTEIVVGKIQKEKSVGKAGRLLEETIYTYRISTIDYDLVLIKDAFAQLMSAAQNGDVTSMKEIPEIGAMINARESKHGWTPLILAVYNGQLEAAKYLIEQGAKTDVVNNNGTTLLMYAKDAFLNSGNSEIFEFLYALGLDPLQRDYTGKPLYEYCVAQNITSIGAIDVERLRP